MTKTVYTAITYDHDRNPLEEFLRAANYKPVPIEVGDLDFFARAVRDNPEGIAVVSSLVNSRGLDIERAWDVVAHLHAGVRVTEQQIEAAGFDDLYGGHYGDKLAMAVSKLSVPNLTVIFSSKRPEARGANIQFVLKRGWSGEREQAHQEILGHLETFFNSHKPA